MSATTLMSVFHQWLLAAPASKESACAIILHCDESWPCGLLIQDIADYLNEYDDEGDGSWLPATPELVEKIARDEHHRRQLGLVELASPGSTAGHASYRQTLTRLGQRGHVIFRSPGVSAAELDLANTFHAGVGGRQKIPDKCHLILNPALLDQKCIAHIVGDVFLEWLHCEMRRRTQFHEI